MNWKPYLAELLGTFLLVLFGCGSVINAVVMGAYQGLFQVAAIWGLGLSLAIYLTASHSGAHLNPAITLAFVAWRRFPGRRALGYVGFQFLGAFLAAAVLYGMYAAPISAFETTNGISRGAPGSEASAMVFGEFFPNPGGQSLTEDDRELVTLWPAFFVEFLGTGLLALAIFGLTAESNRLRPPDYLIALTVGVTLTVLISLLAPLTMAGFNPARDLAPRLFSTLAGWKSIPFTTNGPGWWLVYVLAPCVGALFGGKISELLHGPQRA